MKKTLILTFVLVTCICSSLKAAWKTEERSPLMFTIDCYGGYGFIVPSDGFKILDIFGDDDNVTSYDLGNGGVAGIQLGIIPPSQIIMKFQPFIGFQYYRKTMSAQVKDHKVSVGWDYDDDIFDVDYSMTLDYADITFGCRMFVTWFYFEVGFFGSIELQNKCDSMLATGKFLDADAEGLIDVSNDFGMLFGIGCAFPVHQHISLNIGCRAQVGFLHSVTFGDESKSSITSITLYAGIGFKIF